MAALRAVFLGAWSCRGPDGEGGLRPAQVASVSRSRPGVCRRPRPQRGVAYLDCGCCQKATQDREAHAVTDSQTAILTSLPRAPSIREIKTQLSQDSEQPSRKPAGASGRGSRGEQETQPSSLLDCPCFCGTEGKAQRTGGRLSSGLSPGPFRTS